MSASGARYVSGPYEWWSHQGEATLRDLMRKLGAPALAMVRTGEPEFRPYAGRELSDDEIVELLAAQPRLLERPIVELGSEARIGRPPERVLELFE